MSESTGEERRDRYCSGCVDIRLSARLKRIYYMISPPKANIQSMEGME